MLPGAIPAAGGGQSIHRIQLNLGLLVAHQP
jgi:hypothetical protein